MLQQNFDYNACFDLNDFNECDEQETSSQSSGGFFSLLDSCMVSFLLGLCFFLGKTVVNNVGGFRSSERR